MSPKWLEQNFEFTQQISSQSNNLLKLQEFCTKFNEFSQKVRPFQKLLNEQLYEDLLNFYLDPDSVSSQNAQLPRKIKINENIEVICSRIEGSRDGFTPKKFHELCDNKPNTVTFIKIKGTEEINNFKDTILSKVIVLVMHLLNHPICGPKFGHDIIIYAQGASANYNVAQCSKRHYEKKIRDSKDILV
ncbi:unnamed protein product [Rhizophagus irregularis]|nr:unnamed protein product [Rhizophagus irregularis]